VAVVVEHQNLERLQVSKLQGNCAYEAAVLVELELLQTLEVAEFPRNRSLELVRRQSQLVQVRQRT
jgi:hypothetical protein